VSIKDILNIIHFFSVISIKFVAKLGVTNLVA